MHPKSQRLKACLLEINNSNLSCCRTSQKLKLVWLMHAVVQANAYCLMFANVQLFSLSLQFIDFWISSMLT
jgi:hypothetical protein